MKIIIHAGMHKTGSTSIQNKLLGLNTADFLYLPHPNHSYWIAINFTERPTDFWPLKFANLDDNKVRLERDRFGHEFEKIVEENPAKTLIISSEFVSVMRRNDLARMRDYLGRYCDDLSVVTYVRPPRSFMTSYFQQGVRDGAGGFALDHYYPEYRKRFDAYDNVFGWSNVHFRLFSSQALANGDVITDFLKFIGAPLHAEDAALFENRRFSLEATALLYMQRTFGTGPAFGGGMVAHRNFVKLLANVGNKRFELAPEAVEPILCSERDDLAWMENRLGEPLVEEEQLCPHAIKCEDDLIKEARIARYLLPKLFAQTFQMHRGPKPAVKRIARDMDLLQDLLTIVR